MVCLRNICINTLHKRDNDDDDDDDNNNNNNNNNVPLLFMRWHNSHTASYTDSTGTLRKIQKCKQRTKNRQKRGHKKSHPITA